jgi:ABC-type branched-subunit amino acid transport system ATPase component
VREVLALLDVKDLNKSFGQIRVADHVDLSIELGE